VVGEPIPVEFDVMLTETADHAAASAVGEELRRQRIPFFRTEGADRVKRLVELHVRGADQVRASQAAAMIFARRKRLNQLSPRRQPPPDPGPNVDVSGMPRMP
jgi:hypothetical protein